MPRAPFNDNRDLVALSVRIFEIDWSVLQELAERTYFRPEIWARLGAQLLVDAYQRDGYLIPPLLIVPKHVPFAELRALAKRVETANDEFYGTEQKTFPKTFRYNKRDLEILEKIASRSAIHLTAYLRLALHEVLEMYKRNEERIILPAVLYSARNLPPMK